MTLSSDHSGASIVCSKIFNSPRGLSTNASEGREILRFEEVNGRKSGLHVGGEVLGDMSGQGDILNGDMFDLWMRIGQCSCGRLHVGHDRRRNTTGSSLSFGC